MMNIRGSREPQADCLQYEFGIYIDLWTGSRVISSRGTLGASLRLPQSPSSRSSLINRKAITGQKKERGTGRHVGQPSTDKGVCCLCHALSPHVAWVS